MESGNVVSDGVDQGEEKIEVGEYQLQDVIVTVDDAGSFQHHQGTKCGQGTLVGGEAFCGKPQGADDGNGDGSDVGNKGWNEDVIESKNGSSGVCGDGEEELGAISGQVKLVQLSRPSQIAEVEVHPSAGFGQIWPAFSSDAAVVMSLDIQAPQDTDEPLQLTEHPQEDSDERETENNVLHMNDPEDIVGKDENADQTREVTSSMTIWMERGQATVPDNRIEGVLITDHPGNWGRDLSPRQFPALENVDLESDEDGEKDSGMKGHAGDAHDDSVGGSGDRLEGRVTEEMLGKRVVSEGALLKPSASSNDTSQVLTSATDYVGTDGGEGDDASSAVDSRRDLHKEYPLNYQNYKVCRELSPGVKQCLILETGEQYICVTHPKSDPDGSPGSHMEDMQVDRPGFQTRTRSSHPHGTPGVDEEINLQTSATTHFSSDADTHSYISLQEGGRGMSGARGSSGLDNNQQDQIRNNVVTTSLGNSEDVDEFGLCAEDWILRRRVVNAEDGMLEPRVVNAEDCMVPPGVASVVFGEHDEDVPDRDVVEDVLGSEAEISHQSNSQRMPSLKKSKRTKPEKFIELQPEIVATITEERAGTSESDININNNNNEQDPGGATNINENANSRPQMERQQQRGDVLIRSSYYPSDRSYHTERGDQDHSYDHYMTGSRGVSTAGSRTYSQSSSRERSYFDNRGQRSRDPTSADSSLMSTRYTHVDRGDPRNYVARPTSVTIPKFKTLHDQQGNWLEMFKMIEQQHRTELQSQYQEHQKILQDMQKNMEKELIKQQETLKQRLTTHREMLEELSPDRPTGKNVNQSWMRNEADVHSLDSLRSSDNTSHITLQGVPVALRNPPPISRYHHDTREHKMPDELPVKRSLEKEFSSPVRPADTSLNLSSHVSIDRDKQLRGGVYSSPFPLAKVKHKKSPRGSNSYENTRHGSPRDETSHNTNSLNWAHDRRPGNGQCLRSADVSLTESDEVLSPRTRIALKDKHAKHLADLQSYYEKELRTLREIRASGTQGATAADKILASENQELRQKCQDLQEGFHDAKMFVVLFCSLDMNYFL